MDSVAGFGASGGAVAYAPKKPATGIVIVLILHLLLGWALVSGLAQRVVDVVRSPLETKLIEEIKPPPPPPPPDLPKPVLQPPTALQVPVPVVIPQTPPPPMPVTPPPAVTPPPSPINPPPAPVEAIRAPAPAPVAAPTTATRLNPDQAYIGGLRAYLNSIKRYPTSREARQLKPTGTVRLWLEIDRAGQLLNAGVEATSGHLMLDNEAVRTVRNGRFPPMPPEAFVGQNSLRIVVPIEYTLEPT